MFQDFMGQNEIKITVAWGRETGYLSFVSFVSAVQFGVEAQKMLRLRPTSIAPNPGAGPEWSCGAGSGKEGGVHKLRAHLKVGRGRPKCYGEARRGKWGRPPCYEIS